MLAPWVKSSCGSIAPHEAIPPALRQILAELPHGAAIGETDKQAGQSVGRPYTPSNVLASLYRHLGIDPALAINDLNGRPMHVLDDREPIRELA